MNDPKSEVEKVARLARLRLEPGEPERLAKQFAGLLEHFAQIQKLDTSGVEPLVYPFPLQDVLREDAEKPGCAPEELLRNAPEQHERFYKVPKVIEG